MALGPRLPARPHPPTWEPPVCAGAGACSRWVLTHLRLPILHKRGCSSHQVSAQGRRGGVPVCPSKTSTWAPRLPSPELSSPGFSWDVSHPLTSAHSHPLWGVSWSLKCRHVDVLWHHPVDGARHAAHTCLSLPHSLKFALLVDL